MPRKPTPKPLLMGLGPLGASIVTGRSAQTMGGNASMGLGPAQTQQMPTRAAEASSGSHRDLGTCAQCPSPHQAF
jgi:hypothetical protein